MLSHVVVSLLSGVLGGVIVLVLASPGALPEVVAPGEQTLDGETQPSAELMAEDTSVVDVVERVSPSVASIVITRDVVEMRRFFNSPFDFFFDPFGREDGSGGEAERRRVGGGTGFFVTSDGMLVTNKHVVSDETADYTVVTQDGEEYPAEVLAKDPLRDVAILQVEGSGFPVVELGESDSIRAGQTVIAIGYSLGEFANSVSKGIVSGIGRSILAGSGFGRTERLNDIIQTDAAINPGNSGGPLLDISGRVIGVNVAVAQGAENVGFALPINPIKRIIDEVRETGEITTPFLGIRYFIVNDVVAEANDLEFDYGALVIRGETRSDLAVVPDSPADRAGIGENDILLEINGERITEEEPLEAILSQYRPGDTVTLRIWSEGETREETVTLDARE